MQQFFSNHELLTQRRIADLEAGIYAAQQDARAARDGAAAARQASADMRAVLILIAKLEPCQRKRRAILAAIGRGS